MSLSDVNHELVERAKKVSYEVFAPNAHEVDSGRQFPTKGFAALRESSLLHMLVPKEFGGSDVSLGTYVSVLEALGGGCASTSMCFLMHNVAVSTLAKGGTEEQRKHFLPQLVRDGIIMTQAVTEPGSGSNFHKPDMQTRFDGDDIIVNGFKSFVTNGGHAKWILIYLQAADASKGTNFILVDADSPGVSFEGEWDGMGMAGNSSIAMRLSDVRVPAINMLGGEDGKGEEVVNAGNINWFLTGLSAINVGIAQASLDYAVAHAKKRATPDVGVLGGHQAIRFYLTEMYAAVGAARQYLHHAVEAAMAGDAEAGKLIFSAKMLTCDTSMKVTNLAMQVCGGQGYRKHMPIERWLRDGRAGALMAPTNELMKDWTGKLLLDLPLA